MVVQFGNMVVLFDRVVATQVRCSAEVALCERLRFARSIQHQWLTSSFVV